MSYIPPTMTTTYTGTLLRYWMVGASAVVVLLLIESDTLDRQGFEHCADDDDDEFLMVPARVNLHCVDEERGRGGRGSDVAWVLSGAGQCQWSLPAYLPACLPGRANE